jgi:RND family efflux transporter MFP subunit
VNGLVGSRRIALGMLLAVMCFRGTISIAVDRAAPTAIAQRGTVTARIQQVPQHLQAYGEVRPIALLPLRALAAGVVTGLRVLPGSRVSAGEALASLSGPEIQSLLIERQGALHSAQSRLAAARGALAIERQQLTVQLSTRQSVAAAQTAVAAATAAFDSAQAQLRVAEGMSTLRAPWAGTVLAVSAADGERVAAGQAILTLQAHNRLWLVATYYGADAADIRPGMKGQFQPAGGEASVPVEVAAVAGALAAGGGEEVRLVAASADARQSVPAPMPWLNGEWGRVTVVGATRPMIPVPSAALILDQARWWVLVRTPRGYRPQQVIPGPTRGWRTFIEKGLVPGQQVVVQNAFLEYHRGIASSYTPPED